MSGSQEASGLPACAGAGIRALLWLEPRGVPGTS